MSITIRCACWATYVVEDDGRAEQTADPGDVLATESHHGPTELHLGFTTPALGGEG